jgi:hypothetical protein
LQAAYQRVMARNIWRENNSRESNWRENNFQIASPYYYGQNPRGLSYCFIRIATDGDPVVDAASVVSDCTRMRKNPQHREISTSAALIDRVFFYRAISCPPKTFYCC